MRALLLLLALALPACADGGLSPSVSEVDLTEAEQPEALVVHGGGSSSLDGDVPRVVVHGQGSASVEGDDVVAGERVVRRQQGRWVSLPR